MGKKSVKSIFKNLSALLCFASAASGVLIMSWQTFAGRGFGSLLPRLLNFYGYFTIQSNLLAAFVAAVALLRNGPQRGLRLSAGLRGRLPSAGLRSATLVYMLLTGGIYVTVLNDAWRPVGWSFAADLLLHYTTPLSYLLFWLLHCRQGRPGRLFVLWVLVYPLAYLLWVLAKGALLGMYPYPFFNVGRLGLQAVLGNALLLGAVVVLLACMVQLVHCWLNRHFAGR